MTLLLLHRLEERGLRLRGRPVDLVGQEDVREDGAPLELEVPAPLGVLDDDVRADDVRRHQVRRELDAREREVEATGQGADQEGLPQARDPFEQDVPAREERDEHLVHDLVVTDDDLVDLALQLPVAVERTPRPVLRPCPSLRSMESVRAPDTFTHYRPVAPLGNRFVAGEGAAGSSRCRRARGASLAPPRTGLRTGQSPR